MPSALPRALACSADAPPAAELAPAIQSALASACCAAGNARPNGSEAWLLDLALSPEPLAIRGSAAAIEGLVAALVRAAQTSLALADHAWGTITLATGRTTPHRRFISKAHAIPASAPALADASQIHLEVHDTGAPIEAATLARLRRIAASPPASASASASESLADSASQRRGSFAPEPPAAGAAREEALLDAILRAQRLGASIHLDSTPGCGNQVLVLFPA